MKVIKISLYDKIFIIYIIALSAILFSTFFFNHIWADEGTHMLLAIFYRDLISYIFRTHTISFDQLYKYGINYLISYPKLQIAYTPLFHITASIAFSIFGVSEFVGRSISLLYALGSLLVFYTLVKKFFAPKIALIASILFSFSPIFLVYNSRAMMDSTVFFWLLLSIYTFLIALKKNNLKYYALVGFFVFLAVMGKQTGVFVLLFFLFMIFKNPFKKINWNLENFKKSFAMIAVFTVLILPYLFVMNKVGGIKLNELVAIGYASEQGEPTSVLDYNFWLYYLLKPIITSPLMPVLLLPLAAYSYKKNIYWKQLLLFFFVFYFCLTLIPNKEPRFSQFFMLPAYLTSAYYLAKTKKHFAIFFIFIYILVSTSVFLPKIVYYPTEQIAQFICQNNKPGGNVAFFSEDEPVYSSSLMWYTIPLDKEKNIRFYRSCTFKQSSRGEILSKIDESNIYFVVYSTWSNDKTIEKIKDKLELRWEVVSNGYTTQIYTYKDFNYKDIKKCNFICLTNEMICAQ